MILLCIFFATFPGFRQEKQQPIFHNIFRLPDNSIFCAERQSELECVSLQDTEFGLSPWIYAVDSCCRYVFLWILFRKVLPLAN